MNKYKTAKQIIGWAVCLAAAAYIGYEHLYIPENYKLMHEQVAHIADTNHDRITSPLEWDAVYERLAIPRNQKLELSDLERYVAIYNSSTIATQ